MAKNAKLAARGGAGTILPNGRMGALGNGRQQVQARKDGNRSERREWIRLYGDPAGHVDDHDHPAGEPCGPGCAICPCAGCSPQEGR